MARQLDCPTPWKATFSDKKVAALARKHVSKRFHIEPKKIYQCRCGYWHLASRKKHG